VASPATAAPPAAKAWDAPTTANMEASAVRLMNLKDICVSWFCGSPSVKRRRKREPHPLSSVRANRFTARHFVTTI
jgi:hypothetical protein